MAETLLSPADLADVMSTPEFNDLPFAERQSLVERGLQESSQWLQQDRGGWTPETWRQFGEAANAARQYVNESETFMEKTGSVLSKAGGAVKDALAITGAQIAGISPVLPDGKGGVTFQVPGETSVPMLMNRAGALTGGQVSNLVNDPKPVRDALDEIRAGIDEGAFFNAEGGLQSWLDTADAAVQDAAKAYHGDATLAEQNTLLRDPENAKLVAAYAATRDPSAWTALQKRLERTPLDFVVAADKQKLETQSKLGQAMTPEARSYIAEASDPAEVAGNLLGIGMGAKALSRGLSIGERAKAIGKGLAGEMASEQISASIDDPRLSLEERLQVAKDSIISAAGLTAAGAAPGAIARTVEQFSTSPPLPVSQSPNASVNDRTATPPADETVPDAVGGAGSTPAAGSPVSPLPGIAQRAGTVDVPPLVPGLEAEDIGPLTAADVQDMETLRQGDNQMPQRQPILGGVPDRVAPQPDNQTVGQGDNVITVPDVSATPNELLTAETPIVPPVEQMPVDVPAPAPAERVGQPMSEAIQQQLQGGRSAETGAASVVPAGSSPAAATLTPEQWADLNLSKNLAVMAKTGDQYNREALLSEHKQAVMDAIAVGAPISEQAFRIYTRTGWPSKLERKAAEYFPTQDGTQLMVPRSKLTRTTTTAAATPPQTAPAATPGRGEVGSGGAGGAALLDVAPSTRPRNRGETAKPQRDDVLAELGQATREGAANQAQGTLGFQNLDTSGRTAGFLNTEILAEAEALVRRGVRDFAAWSRAMIARFGEGIRTYLAGVWDNGRRNAQLGAVMNPCGRGPLLAPASDMASASGAAQNAEPSPGGLTEAEGFISERMVYGLGSRQAVVLYHGGPKVEKWQTNKERLEQGAFAGFHLTENEEMAKRYAANSTDAKNAVVTAYYARIPKLWDTRWQKGSPPPVESLPDWQAFPEVDGNKFRLPLDESEYMDAAAAGYDGVISDTTLWDTSGDYTGLQVVVFDPQKNIIPVNPESSRAAGGTGFQNLDTSGRTAGFLNTEILAEATDFLRQGITDFTNWSRAMLTRFGRGIRDYLQGIWAQITSPQTNAAQNVRLGLPQGNAPVSVGSGGFVGTGNAPAANETQARFASPDAAQRVINGPRADVDVAAEATAWLDSVSSEAAVDAFASRAVPLPLDAAEFAAATLISRLTMQGEQAKTEAAKLAAHVQAQRMARVWTKEYLSADPARALRQRGVVNNTILRPIAPVMAAQGILVDRADAVMNKRFEGGAGGVVEKVKAILEKADIDITERVEAILSAVMGSRLQPRVTLAQAVAGLVNGKTQRQQMIDDVARALMQRAKSREVKPGTQTALAALVASLKRTLGAAVKGEALKPETLKMGELLARTFVDQVAEAPLFEEAWKAGREQVRAMLIETGLSETQAEKRLNELMPATPTVAYAPGMVKQAVQRGFEQAGYGQTLTTRMDRSGQRQVDVRAEALRNPQKAMEAVMKVWDQEADVAGISPEAWAQGRALAWKALGETMQQWQAQQQATQAKADAAAKAKLLEKDSPALAKLLKSLKDKIAPGMSWADIFMDMPSSQRERQREIYRRLMLDERLKDLTMEQRLDLTNELDRAWQRERKAVFNRELEKAGILGEKDKGDRDKVKKALPKLLRLMNLGMFNSEMWREIVAPEYGLKMLTAADTAQLRAMAEAAWKLPEGVIRNQKLRDLLNAIQKKTGASWVEVLNSYWTAAVLSGLRTQFDTWLAAVNGMGTNLMQIGSLIARGQGRAAIDAHAQWWRGLFEGVRESGQILFKGDTSYLKRFGADLKKALEGETSVTPVPLGENLWQNGNAFQKYGLAPVMMFTGRLMAAADHINNTATTQGAIAVARALHPELYQGKVGFTAAERANARAQALREVTGGREPQTSEERATVSARAREILNGSLQAEDYAAASEIGDMAAYQNDPTGVFGSVYRAMKWALGSIQRELNDYAQDVTANRFARVAAGVMAGSLHGVTGTRFMRFGANFGADMTRYIPGSYVLGKAGFYGRDVSQAQQELLLGKNLVGLMLMSTLAAVFLNSDDEDEGWQIEGDWSTLNPQQVKERMAAGLERMTLWKRENGQVRRVSYKQWPTMGLFSVVGGMLDEKRHKPAQFAQHGTAGHLLRGIATGYTQIKNVSAVRNLVELFGEPTFSADAVDGTIDKMIKTGTNFAGGFVPTLIKDADIWTDPRSFKPEGVAEMMLRNTPILRKYVNDGRPQLNLLGEEVKLQRAPWSRAYTNVQTAEAHRVLGALLARGLALPMPSDEVKLYQNGVKVPLETLGREAVWQYERAVGQGYKDWLSTDGAALLTLPVDQAEKAIQRRAETIKRQALGRVQR